MKKALVLLVALFAFSASAFAQQQFPVPTFQVSIAGTIAASTRIVTAPTGKQIIVTSLLQIPVALSTVTYTYGTGTNCGTGTGNITGAMVFASGQVLNMGSGEGPILAIPSGNDLCITIATAAAPGSLTYTLVP